MPDSEKSNDGKKGVEGEDDLVHLVFHDVVPHSGKGNGEYTIGDLGDYERKTLRFFEHGDKTGLVNLTG